MQLRNVLIAVIFVQLFCTNLAMRAQVYAGVLGGVATLSGDSHSIVGARSSSSSYDPKNGPLLELLIGADLSEHFSVQGEYIWNSNSLTLTSATFSNGSQQAYQETRSSSQQAVLGDFLIYFRKRGSRLRPFLSVGTGVVHFSSSQRRVKQVIGTPVLPPQHFSTNMIALHVPVGMDVKLGRGWAFRYSFSETLTSNPISQRLSPPAGHNLQNFQNLFGFVKRF